ncbi:serine hydrolase [Patescibacteria group bacterium]|nr:serine hydrolase [Patescibacteria group bacterium]MBU1122989.1 serine hydrolase [Patescibacteria group bacterium]MBU1911671.1 serine hydrolase [Patescibacteria group bacterium]
MYKSVFAALLFGILPVSLASVENISPSIASVVIAPPAEPMVIEERLSASGVVILDLNSGQQLFGKHADVHRPIASLTKLMTALVIIENHELDEEVKIPKEAGFVEGNNAYLPIGEHFTVGDLLSALLIASANDAAYTLAVYHSGTEKMFIEEMNSRTKALGMNETRYANSMGLDNDAQWSTPQDLAWLTAFLMRYPEIRQRMGTRGTRIYSRTGMAVDIVHTHALLHADTSVVAGKTGTTDGAMQCLISVVEYAGREYIVVLLHSSHRYIDMRTILDAIESEFSLL